MVWPVARHQCQGRLVARDTRVAEVARRGPVLRPDWLGGARGRRIAGIWMVSSCKGCDLAGREAYRFGSVLGCESGGRRDGGCRFLVCERGEAPDRKSTRLNSSHLGIS